MSHPCHKDKIANIRRIKGQLEGIERMINDEKYCIDILNQMKAVKNALTSVEAKILETHLKECVKDSLDTSNDNQAKIDEIINVLKDEINCQKYTQIFKFFYFCSIAFMDSVRNIFCF